MIRTARVIFCDNEHGYGDVTFPDLNRDTCELAAEYIAPQTAAQLRKSAKKAGWGRIDGVDYCPLCMENEQTKF